MQYSTPIPLFTTIIALNVAAQTTVPPVLIADLEGANAVIEPLKVCKANNELFFETRMEISPGRNYEDLWKSDGTALGTVKAVSRFAYPWQIALMDVSDAHFYYIRSTPLGDDPKLSWIAIGNSSSKSLTSPSTSGTGLVFNGKLIAAIYSDPIGKEMYTVDPATGTATLLRDINSTGSSTIGPSCIFGQNVFFVADDGKKGSELWVTDGTGTGTMMLKDLCPGSGSSSAGGFTPLANKVYFSAMNAAGNREPWVTDGTTNGTYMIKEVNPSSSTGSNPRDFTEFGGKVYFTADNGTNGRELWVTNGTAAGTGMVADINNQGDASPHDLVMHNKRLWFFARNAMSVIESLYSTDGTAAGTKVQISLPQNNNGHQLVSCNGRLFYRAYASGTSRLLRTDGTSAGTVYVAPPVAANNDPIANCKSVVINNWLNFFANYEGAGMKLWKVQ